MLTPEFLRKNRRVIFVVILIFSAIVTPPDPLTLILLTIPLYMLYEVAVFVGTRLLSGKIQKEKAEEESQKKSDDEYYRKYVEEQSKLEDDYYKYSTGVGSYPQDGGDGGENSSASSESGSSAEEEEFDYEKYYAYSMNEINKMGELESSAKAEEKAKGDSEIKKEGEPSDGNLNPPSEPAEKSDGEKSDK